MNRNAIDCSFERISLNLKLKLFIYFVLAWALAGLLGGEPRR